MLDSTLLEILACPKCKGVLEYRVDEKQNDKGRLICRHCNLVYPVDRDIPNMLIDQAISPAAPSEMDDISDN